MKNIDDYYELLKKTVDSDTGDYKIYKRGNKDGYEAGILAAAAYIEHWRNTRGSELCGNDQGKLFAEWLRETLK